MSWAVGYDDRWDRDIGYGVPAVCDHPDCNEHIHRGLSYVCCEEQVYGGKNGCGLFFCQEHAGYDKWNQCCRCARRLKPFEPKKDLPEWIIHKLTDETWEKWRQENKDWVAANAEKFGVKWLQETPRL